MAAIDSSPSGFTPGPAASECPTRTCRHLTRVGIPPAETPSISGTAPMPERAPISAREARYASWADAVPGREAGVGSEPVVHFVHQPGGLQPRYRRRDHRVGEVKRGGERRTVAEPRRSGGHERVSADAAGRDFDDVAHGPAQLAAEDLEIVRRRLAGALRGVCPVPWCRGLGPVVVLGCSVLVHSVLVHGSGTFLPCSGLSAGQSRRRAPLLVCCRSPDGLPEGVHPGQVGRVLC